MLNPNNPVKSIDITSAKFDTQENRKIHLDNLVTYDFSYQNISDEIIEQFKLLSDDINLLGKTKQLFNGEVVNTTENRSANHVLARNPESDIYTNTFNNLSYFTQKINASQFEKIIWIGIGGSILGVNFIINAFPEFNNKFEFVSNTDIFDIDLLIKKLNGKKCGIIICSKTFTTMETTQIASYIIENLGIGSKDTYGVTANFSKAKEYGIDEANIIKFDENIGGRYSLWSTVSLPLAINYGVEFVTDLFKGANYIDKHFINTPYHKNIPWLMAIIGIININVLHMTSLCIVPYSNRLKLLINYLQQLEMESNGKRVNLHGEVINYHTAPIIWGDAGCDAQHSFFQHLHQGNIAAPVDFITLKKQSDSMLETILDASSKAQRQALAFGDKNMPIYKQCIGNKPNSNIQIDTISAKTLGALISVYEQKVFTQSVIWNINPFDQWGVELGKKITKELIKNC